MQVLERRASGLRARHVQRPGGWWTEPGVSVGLEQREHMGESGLDGGPGMVRGRLLSEEAGFILAAVGSRWLVSAREWHGEVSV